MLRKVKNTKLWDQKSLIWVFLIQNALFGYFWAGILKNYCHILNQQSRICLIAKFCEETKMTKFRTKNA